MNNSIARQNDICEVQLSAACRGLCGQPTCSCFSLEIPQPRMGSKSAPLTSTSTENASYGDLRWIVVLLCGLGGVASQDPRSKLGPGVVWPSVVFVGGPLKLNSLTQTTPTYVREPLIQVNSGQQRCCTGNCGDRQLSKSASSKKLEISENFQRQRGIPSCVQSR